MTLNELEKKHSQLYMSNNNQSRYRAIGLYEIKKGMKDFEEEKSDVVKIHMSAEKYYNFNSDLFHTTHKEEYRIKAQAAKECIITLMSFEEISSTVLDWSKKGETWLSYINYMKESGIFDRIHYQDLIRAYDLITLSKEEE